MRELSQELDKLVNRVHGSEVTRTEQRMRLEQIEQRVLEEFGVEAEDLITEYGPEVLVPGELEARTRESRLREGIPVEEATWRQLERIAGDLGSELAQGAED